MSQDIFKTDPFLLKSESQKEYGRTLLRNVLVRRSSLSGKTRIVDLFNPATWPNRGHAAKLPRPDKKLADAYLSSRINRTALQIEQEREALMRVTMLCRGELTERRLRDIGDGQGGIAEAKFSTHEQAKAHLTEKNVQIDHRLRIATVGVRVKVSKLVDETYLKEDLCVLGRLPRPQAIDGIPDDCGISELGRTKKVTEPQNRRWRRWAETVCNHIQTAVDSGSQVIVLPEFSLPPEDDDETLETKIRQRFKPRIGHPRSPHFIFAGSRHEGGVNRGLVLYAKEDEDPHPTEWHYKVSSARTLGENILGPRSDVYVTYEAEVEANERPFPIHATIAICYDTFDPSTFLSLVLHAASRETLEVPQIILVPSFNPSEQFVQLLRDLSFLTGSIVIYVNSLHGDARAFVAGFSLGDLLGQSCGNLLAQIDAHILELTNLRTAAQGEISKANKRGESIFAREIHKRSSLYQAQLPILKTFRNRIADLQANHALEHLITVERCHRCESGSHKDDYDCRTDILYYNIDVRLLETVQDWRRTYFKLDESFLPEPFHHDQLDGEAMAQIERERNRDGRS